MAIAFDIVSACKPLKVSDVTEGSLALFSAALHMIQIYFLDVLRLLSKSLSMQHLLLVY